MNEENFKIIDNGSKYLTIRISGVAYKNLQKTAEALNCVSWGGDGEHRSHRCGTTHIRHR